MVGIRIFKFPPLCLGPGYAQVKFDLNLNSFTFLQGCWSRPEPPFLAGAGAKIFDVTSSVVEPEPAGAGAGEKAPAPDPAPCCCCLA